MRREFHVRFWEGPRVKFPRATRLVVLFSREDDARRFMAVLPKRFAKYGLTLHPEKTRLVEFRRPPRHLRGGKAGTGTFDLLGFTHLWGIARKGNSWVVKTRTASDRFSRALKRITEWCRSHRHDPVRVQWTTLTRKLKGHYEYYGIAGNSASLSRFRYRVACVWIKWLARRSNKHMTWEDANRLLERHKLPTPRLSHRRIVTA